MNRSQVWCCVTTLAVLAGGCSVSGAAETMVGPSPAQQAAPQERLAAEQPASPQPKVSPEQQTAAEKLGVPVTITNSIGMTLVLIPAGEFLMGSSESPEELARIYAKLYVTPEWFAVEQPQHRVRITMAYYLGMYEVTVKQFRQFVEAKNYRTEAEQDGQGGWGFNASKGKFEQNQQYSWRNSGFSQSDDHPVVNVSWNDAVAFCDWLSDQEGKRYSLPTEAQWEHACRGGAATPFSNGDDPEKLPLVGNVADAAAKETFKDWTWTVSSSDGYVFTSPVGKFQANGFGLYDMHGNIWEWCADWHGRDYYAKSPVDDPPGPATGSARVFRGGSWFDPASYCRSASRVWVQPRHCGSFLGFRVASVPPTSPASHTGGDR